MARTTSEKVGHGVCLSVISVKNDGAAVICGEPITYRRSLGGMLTYKCDYCDSSGYAEPGGSAYKARMTTIQKSEPDPATIAPAASKAQTKREAFSFETL